MSPLDKITEETRHLCSALEEITGCTARWNQVIRFDDSIGDNTALFRPDGEIVVRPTLARQKQRWRVLLHELVHSIATDVRDKYDSNIGWEEGPVEALQRLLRAEVRWHTGLYWDENHLQRVEAVWRYNPYVDAVESIRVALQVENPVDFYRDLLLLPIEMRIVVLLRRAKDSGTPSAISEVGKASAVLKTRLMPVVVSPEIRALVEEEDDET
jgi:hypothetical protein